MSRPFRYIVITEDYEVYGTNSDEYAKTLSATNLVIDTQTGVEYNFDGLGADKPVEEVPAEWFTGVDTDTL
jgi:hypothetical protein